jgi:hypothetical protein
MKKHNAFCLPLVLAILAAACSAKGVARSANLYAGDFAAREAVMAESGAAQKAAADYQEDAADETEVLPETARKLVKRASLTIRVEDLAAADASLNALMEQHGAYAASAESDENFQRYVIRVPHAAYDTFLAGMSGMGRTLNRSESAEDVTIRYYDLEGRLSTKQALLKTYQSYLGKAKNIEEILSVEARIGELQNEIDGTGKELRRLAGLVDFATVNVEMYGPAALKPYRGPTLAERVTELFSGFGGFVSTVLVVLLGMVIYGVPVILLLALLFWIFWGRIGLMKKLWRVAAGNKRKPKTGDHE